MNEFLNKNVSDKLKKILKESVEPYCSILEFSNVRIYISYDDQENFEYTNLEGCLCLVVNRQFSCLYMQLYDYINYKKEFEIELYTNIDKGYSVLHDNFHCIEFPNFFIGINYSNKINAEKMKNTIFYNSIILNFNPKLFHLTNSKQEELNKQKNFNLLAEITDFANKGEIGRADKLVSFSINREENNVVYKVKRDEFEINFGSLGIFISNLDQHCEKKIKGIFLKPKEINRNNIQSGKNNVEESKRFVEFDLSKRKSIYTSLSKTATNTSSFAEEDKRSSIMHLNLQSRLNSNLGEPKTLQEAIARGVKLKAVPKNVEKKVIKVTPLSNDPALKKALELQNKSSHNQINETFSDEED